MSAEITILDGAVGTALRERGIRVPDYRQSAWSAIALIEAPREVQRLHQDYIRAGADVITINNYAVTPCSLSSEGLSHRLAEMTQVACQLAVAARNAESAKVRIAGSLPPLNLSYRADLVGPYDELVGQYREIARLMAPHVDIFLCETMSTSSEARAGASVALELGKPVWLSFTLEDQHGCLRGGETINEVRKNLRDLAPDAVLINCCSALAVEKGLPQMRAFCGSELGVYANPFRKDPPEDYAVDNCPNRLSASDYVQAAERWVTQGVTIIGGCCGTNPSYISALKASLISHSFVEPRGEQEKS